MRAMAKPRKRAKRAESRPAASQMAAAIGRAIQVVRTDRGWSRKELAARSGLSYSFLSEIENGVKELSSRTFAVIAAALDVAPGALLYDAERRLSEVGPEAGDERRAIRQREAGASASAQDSARSSERTRPIEALDREARYLTRALPSTDSAREDAPIAPRRDAGPRIQRSRRVLDWLAGPLARRSSGDPTTTSPLSDGGYQATLADLSSPPTEFTSAIGGGEEENAERFVGALLPLLENLSPEDRELVLALARRLAQRESES